MKYKTKVNLNAAKLLGYDPEFNDDGVYYNDVDENGEAIRMNFDIFGNHMAYILITKKLGVEDMFRIGSMQNGEAEFSVAEGDIGWIIGRSYYESELSKIIINQVGYA